MLTIYTLPSSTSCRKAIAHLTAMDIPFVIQQMEKNPLSYQELKDILYYTDEGVAEIIANSLDKKKLEEEGVDFDEITLSELHYYSIRYPRLIKSPIAISHDRMVIGFDDERYDIFKPRFIRNGIYNKQLQEVRDEEDIRLSYQQKISAGGRGRTL